MNPSSIELGAESIPLRNKAQTAGYLPLGTASQTFGTRYFLISTLFASVIPLIQLIIGSYYKGQCPIDHRIPTYMIVSGTCGLILAGLSILCAITFLCIISDSTAMTLIGGCGVCLNIIATFIISIFLFIWFILGCVWVFSVHSKVQYADPTKTNYCQPVLYKTTFALLIIAIVWFFVQCCLSCFRSCCTTRDNQ